MNFQKKLKNRQIFQKISIDNYSSIGRKSKLLFPGDSDAEKCTTKIIRNKWRSSFVQHPSGDDNFRRSS